MGYMQRALKSRDPRFARILTKLGYDRRDLVSYEQQGTAPDPGAVGYEAQGRIPVSDDDIADLRQEYQDVIGRRAFHGWDAETLREKIASAKG